MNDKGCNHVVLAVADGAVASVFGLYDAADAGRVAAVAGRLAQCWVIDLDHEDVDRFRCPSPSSLVDPPPVLPDDGAADGPYEVAGSEAPSDADAPT